MTTNARHLLVRLSDPSRLPDALLASLRDEVVLAGWVRASGVLADVQLRVLDPAARGPGAVRRIAGPVHAVVIDGSIGLANGDVSCGMRAVLAREGETGLETIAGEIVEARVVALEAIVTALDDVTVAREMDPSGVVLARAERGGAPAAAASAPAAAASAPAVASWSEAASAAAEPPKPEPTAPPAPSPPKPSPTFSAPGGMPLKPVRRPVVDEPDEVYPDAGDVVEHFAFGRCEVVKSDGDRLHVRLGKDGRIKEIALEMLRITPLPAEEGSTAQHFRLDRKL